ncbi:queuosine precursor transporter [Corynebacterium pseudodiphtheriticum]|uniref:queuosine precursor transporter n=1 Tax=Corynebacterium pseudodiphtheriticum TaxID=37637 RepID=UPI00254A0D71|nr:queuosine precursor transporter [Corynebacterium pseudodiphtheriticum]MDK8500271.1 queuosine precursor transporter [Corynebacterium pseudodiphtheriticum]MDK8584129.1 queuosine precursor transporter [Corynebacterium pseudodiphtheriticum]MDK8839865.1 queuosine precursor transporter [Corynebacterium pseudodiphtheriticum]
MTKNTPQDAPQQATGDAHARYIPIHAGLYPIFLAAFVVVFVISNITASKGVTIGPLVTDGAFFLFPIAYIIGDVLAECYGFKATRVAIWTGFASALVAVLAFYVAIWLPAADFYENQEAFSTVLGLVPQIVAASLAGYAVGQLLNAWVLTTMKNRNANAPLWQRLMGSTVVGEFGDTLVFCLIAATAIGISTLSDLVNYVIVGFVWKTAMEAVLLPVTYRVVAWVKNREMPVKP